jgi:hypothetical protein
VRDPVPLTGQWTRPLTAAMWMFSSIEKVVEEFSSRTETPEIESLDHFVPVLMDPSSAAGTSPGMSQPTPETMTMETQTVASSASDQCGRR